MNRFVLLLVCVACSGGGELRSLDLTFRDVEVNVCEGPLAVDESGNVGRHNAIIANGDGAHIAYHDHTHNAPQYATNATGAWTHSNVFAVSDSGQFPSIVLDEAGSVHTAFMDAQNVRYGTNANGPWENEVIADAGGIEFGAQTDIAVAADGSVHIVYMNIANRDLMYATNHTGTWELTSIDVGDEVGKYASLALDPSRNAHVSYSDEGQKNLKYATNAGGVWTLKSFPNENEAEIQDTNIDVSVNGNVLIAYRNGSVRLLDPTSEGVATLPNSVAGDVLGMRSDGNGKTHIVFVGLDENGNSVLSYASNAGGASASDYGFAQLDGDAQESWPSLAVDNAGNVHVSYWDKPNENLMYLSICY